MKTNHTVSQASLVHATFYELVLALARSARPLPFPEPPPPPLPEYPVAKLSICRNSIVRCEIIAKDWYIHGEVKMLQDIK